MGNGECGLGGEGEGACIFSAAAGKGGGTALERLGLSPQTRGCPPKPCETRTRPSHPYESAGRAAMRTRARSVLPFQVTCAPR
jgi:hypothetical protein